MPNGVVLVVRACSRLGIDSHGQPLTPKGAQRLPGLWVDLPLDGVPTFGRRCHSISDTKPMLGMFIMVILGLRDATTHRWRNLFYHVELADRPDGRNSHQKGPHQMNNTSEAIAPSGLRTSFVVHAIADLLFGIPLFFAPAFTLGLFGWQSIDTISARIVAAALFGIGIESWIGRSSSLSSFVAMLNLKVIWSLACVIGIAWSLLEGAHNRPPMAFGVLAIFVVFHAVWVYWRIVVGKLFRAGNAA